MSTNIAIKKYLKKIVENIYIISFCTIFLFLLFVSLISYYKQINNLSYLEFTIKYPSNSKLNFQNKNKFEKFKLENKVDLQFSELFFYQGSRSLNEKIKRLEKKIYTVKNPKKNNQSAIINYQKALLIYKDTFSIKIFPPSKNIEKYKSDVLKYINYIYDKDCKILLDIKSELPQKNYYFDEEIELVFKKYNQQNMLIGFKNFKVSNKVNDIPFQIFKDLNPKDIHIEYKNNEEVLRILNDFLFVLGNFNFKNFNNIEEIKSFLQKNEKKIIQEYGNYNFIGTFKKNYFNILEEIKYLNENKSKTKNYYWYILKYQLIDEFMYEYNKYLNNFAKEINKSNFEKIFNEKKGFYSQNDFTKSEMLALNLYWLDIVKQSLVKTIKQEYKKLRKRNNFIKYYFEYNKLAVQSFYKNYCYNEIIFVDTNKSIDRNFEKQNTNIIIYLFCFIISLCVVLIFFNIKIYNKKK